MASTTYYAVLPFVRDDDGNLCPDEAIECQSPAAASARARVLAATRAGTVAFSRTGDPNLGDWSDGRAGPDGRDAARPRQRVG